MKWLKNVLGLGVVDTERVMDHALRLMQQGQHVEAISQMQAAVESVKEAAGCPSCEYAKGLFNLAMLYLSSGDMSRGAEQCRLAADSCPDSTAGRKDRLMYLMNAGQLLNRAGETQLAIEVLTTSLREREAAYGPEHAGTAYGQQALAEVLMSAGRFDEGLAMAEQALAIFAAADHQEVPTVLATTTALASAAGRDEKEVWGYVPQEAASLAKPMVDAALVLAESMPGDTGMCYLQKLSDWASQLLPPDSPQLMNVVALWSNIATERGNNEHRKMAIERAVFSARQMDDPAVVVNALEGYALLLSDLDASSEDVREAYRKALAHANEHGLAGDAAGALRNWALFESENGENEQAGMKFSEALEQAKASGDDEMLARTQIAFGIFYQHQNRPDEAISLLESGIESLDPLHPDAACAMLHQVALHENLDCPCNGGESIAEEALTKLAERFFSQSGLSDLVQSVSVGGLNQEGPSENGPSENGPSENGPSENGPSGEDQDRSSRDQQDASPEIPRLKVQLSRQPSADERRRIEVANGVFQNLLAGNGKMR